MLCIYYIFCELACCKQCCTLFRYYASKDFTVFKIKTTLQADKSFKGYITTTTVKIVPKNKTGAEWKLWWDH